MNTENFVTYNQAIKLKELGFDERTTYEYTEIVKDSGREEWDEDEQRMMFIEDINYYPKLRLDQAQAWLREAKGWDVTSIPTLAEYGRKKYRWDVCHWSKPEYGDCSNGIFDTYESALSAGIDKALELLTNKS